MTTPVRLVRGFNCPSCGAAIELRAGTHTRNVACAHCHSVIDATDPNLAILQRFEETFIEPAIPLGSRGTLHGATWEAIGFQQRTITVDGENYSWREYLLFNPYRGYRYLTEYDGHWNDVTSLRTMPSVVEGMRPTAHVENEQFRHFQSAEARTTYVVGEFPWQVRVGDRVAARDFVSPPRLLSQETTDDETTWSLGTYADGREIWKAFRLDGSPPRTVGVFANQPNPHRAHARRVWRIAALLALILVVVGIGRCATAANDQVFAQSYLWEGSQGDSSAFVTAPFTLSGGPSNVRIDINADLDNSALFLDLGLVNAETGDVRDVGRELAYFHGVEDGESWREGSTKDAIILGEVPPGRYYLRVRPEGGVAADGATPRTTRYTIRVRRDVPRPGYWLLALGALLLPTIWPVLRAWSFEQTRWQQSDYASSTSSDDEEDDSGEDDE
jgi:hypothetical protein